MTVSSETSVSAEEKWSAVELSRLPVRKGFRLRGMEMTRLETFTDAAFAFAVTLLVIGGGDPVPTSFEELNLALRQVPAFAASFANIMLFWYAHHIWSRRFGLEDTVSVLLSLLLIFLVLIYVYPLKAVYSGAIDFFSRGVFESYFELRSYADLRSLFAVFGVAYASLSFVIVLLNRHAIALTDELALSAVESFDVHTDTQQWMWNIAVAVFSVSLALLLPDRFVFVAGLAYCLHAVVLPWHGARRDRGRQALDGTRAEES